MIEEFCIDLQMQGQGIGSSFLKAVEVYLAENRIYRIFLQTENDVPAYRFYQRHGFQELTRHVSFSKTIGE